MSQTGWYTSNDNTSDRERAHVPHDSALSVGGIVGGGSMEDAARIKELEAEVRELTHKVASASQRFADYENEIRVLHAQVRQEKRRNASQDSTASMASEVAEKALNGNNKPGISRFGSFMHSRKPTALQPCTLPPPTTGTRERELEEQLVEERKQRLAAETKARDTSAEIEELTTSLFEEANVMVSEERKINAQLQQRCKELEANGIVVEERKENARLKERCEFLETRDAKFAMRVQALEQREKDRLRRLDRLERAQERVEKITRVLVPP